MIVFDLKCAQGHVFEAWFGSSQAYADQRAAGLLMCPVCGDGDVDKAVMAPNVAAKGNQRPEPSPKSVPAPTQLPVALPAGGDATPAAAKAALAMLAKVQAELLKSSTWVGTAFVDRARAMHSGDEPHAPIHGQASPEDARALAEEGVPVAPLIVPVVPPEALN